MQCGDPTQQVMQIGAARPGAPRPGHGVRPLLTGSVMVLCLVTAIVQASGDGEWLYWGSNFVFFGLMLNYLAFVRSRNDGLEPVILAGGMFMLAFMMRGLFLHFSLDPVRVNPWVSSNLRLLGEATGYTVAGFGVFLCAYYSPVGSAVAARLPRMRCAWRMDQLGTKAIRIYCVCLPAKLMGILPAGAYGFQETLTAYLGSVIGLMAGLTDIALLLYSVYHYHHRARGAAPGRGVFYGMLVVQLSVGFLSGYREPMFVTLLALVFVRHYMWRRLKPPAAILGFLALMLAVTPISRGYRHLVWVDRQNPTDAVDSVLREAALQMEQKGGSGGSVATYCRNSLLNISERCHGMDSLITCLATVPDYLEYQRGKTLYLLPLTVFVPRALWPEKPKIGLGTFFRERIWKGPLNDSDSGGQIAITQIGELYVNFGVWGIVLGMIVLGMLHRCVYSYAMMGHGRGNYSVLLFYYAAVLCFLAVERNFAFAYGYLIKLFLCLYFVCRYLNGGPVFSRAGACRDYSCEG